MNQWSVINVLADAFVKEDGTNEMYYVWNDGSRDHIEGLAYDTTRWIPKSPLALLKNTLGMHPNHVIKSLILKLDDRYRHPNARLRTSLAAKLAFYGPHIRMTFPRFDLGITWISSRNAVIHTKYIRTPAELLKVLQDPRKQPVAIVLHKKTASRRNATTALLRSQGFLA